MAGNEPPVGDFRPDHVGQTKQNQTQHGKNEEMHYHPPLPATNQEQHEETDKRNHQKVKDRIQGDSAQSGNIRELQVDQNRTIGTREDKQVQHRHAECHCRSNGEESLDTLAEEPI